MQSGSNRALKRSPSAAAEIFDETHEFSPRCVAQGCYECLEVHSILYEDDSDYDPHYDDDDRSWIEDDMEYLEMLEQDALYTPLPDHYGDEYRAPDYYTRLDLGFSDGGSPFDLFD